MYNLVSLKYIHLKITITKKKRHPIVDEVQLLEFQTERLYI